MTTPIQAQEDAMNPVLLTVEVTLVKDQCPILQGEKNFVNLQVPHGVVIEVGAIQGVQEYWDPEKECLQEGEWLRVHMVFENVWFHLEQMTTTEDLKSLSWGGNNKTIPLIMIPIFIVFYFNNLYILYQLTKAIEQEWIDVEDI